MSKEFHVVELKVRYNEVDSMGIVNNNVYHIYFEEARISLLNVLGYDYINQNNLLFQHQNF